MILIADSGSTKTDWVLVRANGKFETCTTGGINPFFQGTKEITEVLKKEFTLPASEITAVYFYGAGATPEKSPVVLQALSDYFPAKTIEVETDLLGAARSLCRQDKGIACILGTGSNSCYYDGERIVDNVPPLGYILGDEGSGAVLGKKLIADILKNQLPHSTIRDFQETYTLQPAEMMNKVYNQPFPNRFLAQFVPFIANHIADLDMKKLVEDSFSEFVRRNLCQYEQRHRLPVHFTGSVAFYFKNNLEDVLRNHRLQLGKVTQNPLPGLIEYHKL